MSAKLGNAAVLFYLGDMPVAGVYLGAQEIYSAAAISLWLAEMFPNYWHWSN